MMGKKYCYNRKFWASERAITQHLSGKKPAVCSATNTARILLPPEYGSSIIPSVQAG